MLKAIYLGQNRLLKWQTPMERNTCALERIVAAKILTSTFHPVTPSGIVFFFFLCGIVSGIVHNNISPVHYCDRFSVSLFDANALRVTTDISSSPSWRNEIMRGEQGGGMRVTRHLNDSRVAGVSRKNPFCLLYFFL